MLFHQDLWFNCIILIDRHIYMHMRLPIFLTFLLIATLLKAEVSLTNLQAFW